MKLGDLERHLRKHNCFLLREGGGHSIYKNPKNGLTAAVPRHNEIANVLANAICKKLEIPRP